MLTRFTIARLLCFAITPALILLPTSLVIAQSESEDPHSYCKSKAQDLTDDHFKSSNLSGAVNNAAIGAVLGRSVGNTATGVVL